MNPTVSPNIQKHANPPHSWPSSCAKASKTAVVVTCFCLTSSKRTRQQITCQTSDLTAVRNTTRHKAKKTDSAKYDVHVILRLYQRMILLSQTASTSTELNPVLLFIRNLNKVHAGCTPLESVYPRSCASRAVKLRF